MRQNKRIGLTFLFFLLFCLATSAQNYMRDAGIRIGRGVVANYRHFYKDERAIEFFAGYQERGMRIGGMQQYFIPALTKYSENFRVFYGYGVHTGFTYTNGHRIFNREYRYDWIFSPVFGVNGNFGLEYTLPEVPICVSTDIKPFFEFSTYRIYYLQIIDVSLSVKYRF